MVDYKAGDTVSLLHKNGDTAKVTASFFSTIGVQTESNYFYFVDGWSVVSVETPGPDEPKGLGAVVTFEGNGADLGTHEQAWLRDHDGDWLDEDGDVYTWTDLLGWSNRSTIRVQTEGYVGD